VSNPVASVEIQARSSGLAAQLREIRAQFGRFADGIGAGFDKQSKKKGGLFSGFGGAASTAGGVLAANAISRVTHLAEEGAEGVFDFERNLTRFGIAARQTPAEIDTLRSSIGKLSIETGKSREDILGGARAFVDLAGAAALTDSAVSTIARTSAATGSDVKDIATVMYSLTDAMKIKPAEMESTLSGLVNQSKDGSVHFNQFAEEIIAIAPQFARFGQTGRTATMQLGAMFQVMRSGFKDPAETATGMSGIFKGLVLHADKFAKAGVKVYDVGKDGTKHLKPLSEIFAAIDKSKLIKDPTLLQKAFGRGEGMRAYQIFDEHLKKFDELVAAGQATDTIGEDLKTNIESPAGAVDAALNKLKVTIAEAFTPERIAAFSAAVVDLASKVGPLVGFVEKIGGVLGGFEGVGVGIRNAVLGTKASHYRAQDEDILNDPLTMAQAAASGGIMSVKHRQDAARRNMANVDAYNAAAENIMSGEVGEKTSPESIKRAFAAKYGKTGGEREAGATYLTNAGVRDPVSDAINRLHQDTQQLQADAFVRAMAKVAINLTVEVDGNAIAVAHKKSAVHRQGVAK
jgi:TP901 family phage tail tape measure protein